MVNCWICEQAINKKTVSHEHEVKRSDSGMVFGDVSQKKPVRMIRFEADEYIGDVDENLAKMAREGSYSDKMGTKIGSLEKSDHTKFDTPICSNCNTSRSSNWDNAWEILSEWLFANGKYFNFVDICYYDLDLSKIIPIKYNYNDINRFFMKNMGCYILDSIEMLPDKQKALLLIEHLKKHLMTLEECNNFYLFITKDNNSKKLRRGRNRVSLSPICIPETSLVSDIYVEYVYAINDIKIVVKYTSIGELSYLNNALVRTGKVNLIRFIDYQSKVLYRTIE